MRNLITLLTVLFTIPVFGQNNYIGLKGGLNWFNINSDDFSNNKPRNGFMGGLTYEHEFESKFHIGLDLLYAQKGFKDELTLTDEEGNLTGEEASTAFNYNYLSVPIKGGFSIGNNLTGFLNLGVVPAFLMKATITTPGVGGSDEETIDVTEDATSFDFGGLIEIGGGYKFNEQLQVFTSFSYQHSFTDFTNDDHLSYADARHHGMNISLGVKYVL